MSYNLVRKPGAGKPHARFDERDVETEHGEASEAPATERAGNRYAEPKTTAPHLDSTEPARSPKAGSTGPTGTRRDDSHPPGDFQTPTFRDGNLPDLHDQPRDRSQPVHAVRAFRAGDCGLWVYLKGG